MSRRAAQLFASVLVSCAQQDGQSVFDPRSPLQPTGACWKVADEPPGSPPTLLDGFGFGRLSSTLVPLESSVARVVTLTNVPCLTGNGRVRAWLTDSAGRREVSAGPVAFSADDETLSTAVTFQTSVPGRLELEVDFVGVGTARQVLTAVEDRSAAQPAADAVLAADSDEIFLGGTSIGRVFVPVAVGSAVWSSVVDGGQLVVSSWLETGGRLVKRGEHPIEGSWAWTGTSESRLVFSRQGSARTLTWQLGALVEEPVVVPPGWSRPIAMAGGGFVGLDQAGFCEVAADGGCALERLQIAELRSEGVVAVPPGDDRFVLFDGRARTRAVIELPPSSRLFLANLSRGVEGAGSHATHEGFVLVPRFDDRPRLIAFRGAGAAVKLTRDWVFLGRYGYSR